MTGLSHWLNLIRFKAYADLKSESTKTYVGIFWWVLDPLLYMTVMYVVFAVLLEKRTPDFVAFLLVGLVYFRWFSATVGNCAFSILGGKALMQQVYLPKIIFPVVVILINLIKFLIILCLLLVFLWLQGHRASSAYLALPALMMIQFVMVCGTSFIVAGLVPLLPDLKHIVDNIVLALLFLSGIFYSGRDLPLDKQQLLYLNPMARLIEGYRDILIDGRTPDVAFFVYPALVAIVLLLIGTTIVVALNRQYPMLVRKV